MPSNVNPTIRAAIDATANCTKNSNDDALPPMSGNGVSAAAVAPGMVVISATMNTNIGATTAAGWSTRNQASAASTVPAASIVAVPAPTSRSMPTCLTSRLEIVAPLRLPSITLPNSIPKPVSPRPITETNTNELPAMNANNALWPKAATRTYSR